MSKDYSFILKATPLDAAARTCCSVQQLLSVCHPLRRLPCGLDRNVDRALRAHITIAKSAYSQLMGVIPGDGLEQSPERSAERLLLTCGETMHESCQHFLACVEHLFAQDGAGPCQVQCDRSLVRCGGPALDEAIPDESINEANYASVGQPEQSTEGVVRQPRLMPERDQGRRPFPRPTDAILDGYAQVVRDGKHCCAQQVRGSTQFLLHCIGM